VELEVEMWIDVACDEVIGSEDFFQFNVDEVVVGVDVLLDKATDFEKRWY
jgi:hypothetical protein